RGEHLQRLGWSFHRLWSTNWFADPQAEVTKLRDAYRRAVDRTEPSPDQPSPDQPSPDQPSPDQPAPAPAAGEPGSAGTAPGTPGSELARRSSAPDRAVYADRRDAPG